MKINIETYNKEWTGQFEKIKTDLCSILVKLNPNIEHIGSTSVPNLAAKPIIDIQVGIGNSFDLDKTIGFFTQIEVVMEAMEAVDRNNPVATN